MSETHDKKYILVQAGKRASGELFESQVDAEKAREKLKKKPHACGAGPIEIKQHLID